MKEKTINICGKEVRIIYCAATENLFEDISGKSTSVFVPTFGKDKDGKDIVVAPPKATIGDFVTLAVAGIIAAYTKSGEEMPVTSEDILYSATPYERNELLTTVVDIRNEWYNIPKVVDDTLKKEAAAGKEKSKKN